MAMSEKVKINSFLFLGNQGQKGRLDRFNIYLLAYDLKQPLKDQVSKCIKILKKKIW